MPTGQRQLLTMAGSAQRAFELPTLSLPQATTDDLFEISNGPIELVAIVGVVTTVIGSGANNTKLQAVSRSATTDLCVALDIDADALYSRYSITGTLGNAMINTDAGVPVARQATPLILDEGIIRLNCAGSSTGSIKWGVLYNPLARDAFVTQAA